MKRFTALLFLISIPLFSQSNSGELRLKVTDPSGSGLRSTVELVSQSNESVSYTHLNRRKSKSRGKLFYRLAQQAVQVGPVPFATLVKPQPVVYGGVK